MGSNCSASRSPVRWPTWSSCIRRRAFLIGYGFLFLRPWAWGLAMAYGGFGLTSELMNQFQFGFHHLRTGFMATTALFLCYVAWRRILFADPVPSAQRLASSSPEVPL